MAPLSSTHHSLCRVSALRLARPRYRKLLRARGLWGDHTTVLRWVQRDAPELDQRCQPSLQASNDSSCADETSMWMKPPSRFRSSGPTATGPSTRRVPGWTSCCAPPVTPTPLNNFPAGAGRGSVVTTSHDDWWGIPPTRLDLRLGRHLRRAMRPKFSTYKIRIWAIMLKNFHISRPNGRLDRHCAQGCWAGYVETFPSTQSLNETAAR
jgi:hypothetical protein